MADQNDSTPYQFFADAGLGGISSVVSSLPLGYSLGDERTVNSVQYRLVHNAGNSQINPGFLGTPANGSVGPHSITISSASQKFHHMGAALVVHATLTTGSFGWGAVKGYGLSVAADNTSVPTGSAFYVGVNGTVDLMPQSVVTGNLVCGINLGGSATKTVTTGAASGDCFVSFI